MILIPGNKISGRYSCVLGDKLVKSDDKKEILFFDAIFLLVWAMSQSLH